MEIPYVPSLSPSRPRIRRKKRRRESCLGSTPLFRTILGRIRRKERRDRLKKKPGGGKEGLFDLHRESTAYASVLPPSPSPFGALRGLDDSEGLGQWRTFTSETDSDRDLHGEGGFCYFFSFWVCWWHVWPRDWVAERRGRRAPATVTHAVSSVHRPPSTD
ncbi:hypothetical protein LZ30DRAFT_484713 [Colletotrichum cereale]|nr:hypothetical protein LZ30DRAFT_484713 [Colletotrichum cereale]